MPEIKRIKQLEEESRKQKQMVGEQAMIKLNAISAILFDLGDTLITRTSDHTKCKIDALNEVHELLSKVGNSIPVQEFQELEDTMWKKMKEDYGREQLEFKMDIFINNLLLEVNVDRDDRAKLIPQISKIIYKHDLRSLVLNKYVDEVLKTLKQKKYILGIITNTSYSYQHIINILDNFQIRKYFKNVVVSSVEEVCKPNPKIFLKALEDLNVQPVNAVYVGNDLQVDIEGAINVGMKAIYISERGSRKMKESNHQNVRVASDIREVIHHVEGYIREVYAGKTDQKLESETRGLENALARAIYEYLYRTVEYSPFFTSRVNEQIRFFYFYQFVHVSLLVSVPLSLIASTYKILFEYTALGTIRICSIIEAELLLGMDNSLNAAALSIVYAVVAYLLSLRFKATAKGIIISELNTRHVFLASEKEKIIEIAKNTRGDNMLLDIFRQRIDKEKGTVRK